MCSPRGKEKLGFDAAGVGAGTEVVFTTELPGVDEAVAPKMVLLAAGFAPNRPAVFAGVCPNKPPAG